MSEQVERLYSLAETLGVSLGEACDRAQIARSTPSRWRRGTKPHAHLLTRLEAAIRAVACEQGMSGLIGEHGREPLDGDARSVVRSELRRARRSLDRIAEALGLPGDE